MEIATVRDRPEVAERAWELTRDTLPEYNNHGDVLNRYWPRLTAELPKTRSGKIMRRLLRDVAENRELGDTTTLADPAVVEEIKERAETERSDDA